LARAQRFTLAMVYDLPYFKDGNWFRKNVIGNWMFSPLYTYESGEWITVQSGQDVNLNIDSAGDRVIYNAAGVRGTGSDVYPTLQGCLVQFASRWPSCRVLGDQSHGSIHSWRSWCADDQFAKHLANTRY
jgi:hypothetical protein